MATSTNLSAMDLVDLKGQASSGKEPASCKTAAKLHFLSMIHFHANSVLTSRESTCTKADSAPSGIYAEPKSS